jgi:uridine phosphorylase
VSGWYPGKLIADLLSRDNKYRAQTYSSATDQMAALRQQYIEKWKRMGLTDHQIDMALRLATDWVEGMEAFMMRSGATISPQTTVDLYRTALGVADRWVNRMFTERLW